MSANHCKPYERLHSLDTLFRFIVTYMRDHDGLPPTLREIAEATGASIGASISYNLARLEGQGRITVYQGQSRGIRLARPPRCECCGGIDYARLLDELETARAETRDREAA